MQPHAFLAVLLVGQVSAKQTLRVPMHDGITLATDLYLPTGKGPFPVVLVRTPYDKNAGAGIGADGAKRGYAVVVQDTRGRFASGGENLPFEGDGWWAGLSDGKETVDWVRQQPWCNGKVGTWGGSALGITQLGLLGAGAAVDTSYILVASPHQYRQVTYPGGIFKKAMIEDWLKATNHDPKGLQTWLSHPTEDAYWRERTMDGRWGKINASAVHLGGWFDIFGQGTIDSFVGLQTKGGPKARGRQVLIMGPWTHGVLSEKAGALTFPKANKPPYGSGLDWEWFDYQLKGQRNRWADAPAVIYYTMGDTSDPRAPGNTWRTTGTWPPLTARATPLYLQPDKSVAFTKPSAGSTPLTFTYDPKNPAPTVGGPQLTLPAGPMDQRTLTSRPDVLTFTSAPLSKPLEVTGRVRAKLWVSSDGPDTDIVVKLCDLYPDGRSFNLCEGQLRLRFREGFAKEKLLKPGQIVPIELDLWSTSIVFNQGHRLQVIVTSSSAPGLDPNPNTGAPLRSGTETRIAHNTLYADPAHPSQLILPVIGEKKP